MKTVAVFFGGRSTEHDVSIITALTSVIKPLELSQKYTVVPVYISKDGTWYVDDALKVIATYQRKDFTNFLSKLKPTGVKSANGMKLMVPGRLGKTNEIAVDIAFPAMHGTYGEDGALMGLLDMMNVPYVGCSVSAAAVAMDKLLTKQVVSSSGIAVTPYVSFLRSDIHDDVQSVAERVEARLAYPVFIKPTHLGSSIGITRANNRTELQNGLEVAAHYDTHILVEEGVANLVEVTLPIIGTTAHPRPALLEQPLTVAEDFFDFETKYMHGGKKGKGSSKGQKNTSGAQGHSILPADLPKKLYDKAEATGIAAYKAIGCEGIARVDMLIDTKTETVFCNEINPLPGSLYAHNWAKAGLSRVDLVQDLIALAEARHQERTKQTTVFKTNFLSQF